MTPFHFPKRPRRFSLKKQEEKVLFFKQLVKNPRSLGAIVPSSEALGTFISQQLTIQPGCYFVEIGAGTGSLTKALLQASMDPRCLYVVELDPMLAAYLRKHLPDDVTVITGDARDLENLLPPHIIGHVEAVISGIPMMNLNTQEQWDLIDASFRVMHLHGSFLQFSYSPLSPLPAKKLGLEKKRVGHVLKNFPPATVWRYNRPVTQEAV